MNQTIRYAYNRDINSVLAKKFKASDITIAYLRSEKDVKFAFTFCNKNDTFVKSVGREVSSKTLQKFLESGNNYDCFVDLTAKVGTLSLEYMLDRTDGIDNILSDQMLKSIKATDLKHAFILDQLITFLIDAMFSEIYN